MGLLKSFIKHYWFFLLVIVLISYGQILGMGIWKDDNAIFFKFDHLYERTGFFGKGILGAAPYRFSITPYYPIYKIFGNQSIVPYYALVLIFYYVSTLCVYFLYSRLFSPLVGRVSAFLFAAGYIASEGFYWLSNSMLHHMSILLITFILYLYNRFFIEKKLKYYLFALVFYWLSAFLVPLRTHYFIIIVLFFEFIYFTFKKFPNSFINSILRILPFLYIFYRFFILNADSRALSVNSYILSVARGEFYKTFSFFTSLSNLLIPDNIINRLAFGEIPVKFIILILFAVFFCYLFNKKNKKWLLVTGSTLVCTAWMFLSKSLYTSSLLSITKTSSLALYLGGIFVYLLSVLYFLMNEKTKRHYLFLALCVTVSILTYAAYGPTAFFGTTHRYFTNAFFFLVGLLGIVYIYFLRRKDVFGKLICLVILLWGATNIVYSFSHQHNLLLTRSIPVANFYKQLKTYLPVINKGDILYFDVNDNAQLFFSQAFSVSSMPETTAIAWRYDIDRYDFEMYTDYDELISVLSKDNNKIWQLFTFYYDKDGLVDTTSQTRNLLNKGSGEILPLTPMLLTFRAEIAPDYNKITKLYTSGTADTLLKQKMAAYLLNRNKYYSGVKAKSLSEWKYQEVYNAVDNNPETSWRGHRIWWHNNKKEYITIDLGKVENINRVIWTNWIKLLTPTSYLISVSENANTWKKVLINNAGTVKKDGEVVVEKFDPNPARYVRFEIYATLSDDSPAISEIEAVETKYSNVDIYKAFAFSQNPFEGALYNEEVRKIAEFAAPFLKITVGWRTNKGNYSIKVLNKGIYSQYQSYSVILKPSGTKLDNLDIGIPEYPFLININSIKLRNLSLKEMREYGIIKSYTDN